MIINFAITIGEMGLRNWQIVSLIISLIVFPITFIISSKNFDASMYRGMIDTENEDK